MAEKTTDDQRLEGLHKRLSDHDATSPTSEKRKVAESTEDEPLKKKPGITFGLIKKKTEVGSAQGAPPSTLDTTKPMPAIKMSLGVKKPKETQSVVPVKKSATVASVFNQDDDSEEEEMPPEARMRMRNIGRKTPTAAGPNSFGKSQLGFCDRQKIIARELQREMDKVGDK